MNPTQDTLDLVRGALNTPDDRIAKTISISTGLVAYDLQAPAKNLFPVVTPIRNSLPRVGGGTGTASNWRQVVALTLEGYQNSALATGVATTKTITGADGKTFVLSGGSSNKSANATQAVTLGQTLFASVTALQGAVAYAWYIGTAGAETLQAITTINSATFAAPLAGGQQAVAAVTADNSANPNYAYDGLLTAALKAGSNAYVSILPTGTAGTGTPLTASGRGSVNEIDTMFQQMWNQYQVSPTVLYVNVQELKNITAKVLSNASGPLLRYEVSGDGNAYDLAAAGAVSFYFNPFTLNGGLRIPVRIHPRVPAGTIIGWAENLPIQYQSNEVPNVAEIKSRQDYYQIHWPVVTRQRQVGVYAEEVLAIYAPFALGVITNIGNG